MRSKVWTDILYLHVANYWWVGNDPKSVSSIVQEILEGFEGQDGFARGNGRDQSPGVARKHYHRHKTGQDVHRTAGDSSRHNFGTWRDRVESLWRHVWNLW